MELIKFSARNFLSIGNQTQEFKFYKNQIVLYKGNIGAGKSTFLDGVSIILFGKSYSGKNLPACINWTNKKNCELSIEFKMDGNHYKAFRNMKPDAYGLFKDGEPVDLSNKDDLTVKLMETLKIDKKIFDQTVFVSSNFYTPFMKLSLGDRREVIKRLFSLEVYEHMQEEIKQEVKEKKKEKDRIETKVVVMKDEVFRREQEKTEEIKTIEESITAVRTEIEALEETTEKMVLPEYDVDDHIETSKLIASTNEKLSLQKNKLENTETNISSYNASIASKAEFESQLAEAIPKKKNELSLDATEKRISEIMIKGSELKSIYEANIKHRERYLNLKGLVANHPNAQGDIEKLQGEHKDLSEEILKKSSNSVEIRSKMSFFEDKIKYYNSSKEVCGECGKPITSEEKQTQISSATEKLKELEKTIPNYSQQQTRQKAVATEIEALQKVSEAERQIAELDVETIEKLETMKSEMISLKAELDVLIEHKTVIRTCEYLKQQISSFDNIKQPIDDREELRQTIDELNSSLPRLIEKEALHKKNQTLLANEKEKKNEITQEIKTKEAILNEKLSRLKEVETRNQEALQQQVATLEKEMSELERDLDRLDKLLVLVGDNGIKKFIVGRYLAILNKIVNKYLNDFSCEFQIAFTSKKGLSCDIINRGEDVPFENLSNGQSQQINLAILFTFIEFLKLKNNSNFPAIFLDEMFDNSMSPTALREVIKGVAKNIPYVNIISHRETNFEMADVLIEVVRDNRFSKYNVLYDVEQ